MFKDSRSEGNLSAVQRACEEQLYRYALCQDTANLEGFVALFDQKAVWKRPGIETPIHGFDRIVENARSLFGARADNFVCQHIVTNIIFEAMTESTASCICYAIAFAGHRSDGALAPKLPSGPGGILRYKAEFGLAEDGWKFTYFEAIRIFVPQPH